MGKCQLLNQYSYIFEWLPIILNFGTQIESSYVNNNGAINAELKHDTGKKEGTAASTRRPYS